MRAASCSGDGDKDKVSHPKRIAFSPECRLAPLAVRCTIGRRHGTRYPVPALDRVRYIGEPVAVVATETPAQAIDAAELVAANYEPLPAVARSRDALAPGAPVLWATHDSNLAPLPRRAT